MSIRIEAPLEVEEVLYQHPKIHKACMGGMPDPYRGEEEGEAARKRPRVRVALRHIAAKAKLVDPIVVLDIIQVYEAVSLSFRP